jgi:hypothetical protein
MCDTLFPRNSPRSRVEQGKSASIGRKQPANQLYWVNGDEEWVCYICNRKFEVDEEGEYTGPDYPNVPEGEHPMHIVLMVMVGRSRAWANGFTHEGSDIAMAIACYCCNREKSQDPLFSINPETGKISVNDVYIKNLLEKIYDKRNEPKNNCKNSTGTYIKTQWKDDTRFTGKEKFVTERLGALKQFLEPIAEEANEIMSQTIGPTMTGDPTTPAYKSDLTSKVYMYFLSNYFSRWRCVMFAHLTLDQGEVADIQKFKDMLTAEKDRKETQMQTLAKTQQDRKKPKIKRGGSASSRNQKIKTINPEMKKIGGRVNIEYKSTFDLVYVRYQSLRLELQQLLDKIQQNLTNGSTINIAKKNGKIKVKTNGSINEENQKNIEDVLKIIYNLEKASTVLKKLIRPRRLSRNIKLNKFKERIRQRRHTRRLYSQNKTPINTPYSPNNIENNNPSLTHSTIGLPGIKNTNRDEITETFGNGNGQTSISKSEDTPY